MERGESSFALGSWKENTTFAQLGLAECEAAGGLLRPAFICAEPRRWFKALGGPEMRPGFSRKRKSVSRGLKNKILKPVYL